MTDIPANKNCYFYTHKDGNDLKVAALCTKCHDERFPDLGWFWNGYLRGYGPYLFACAKCGDVIYRPEEIKESASGAV